MNISEFREQYPQYKDVGDQQLAETLHQKYYSDMPKDQFMASFGIGDPQSVASAFPEPRTETRAALELPELGSGGLLSKEDKFTVARIAPVLLTTTDPVEISQILTSNFPNVGISQDPGGNMLATNNETGAQVIINRPGLSKTDLMQGFGIGSLFIPTSVAGASIGALAKGAAGALGTQAVIEGTQAASGGDVDPQDMAIAAIAAPVGQFAGERVVAPAIKHTIKKPLSAALDKGKNLVSHIVRSADEMGEEVAAKSLAESMIREGLTPDQVVGKLSNMGDEAMLGDVGNSFRRLLRTASNELPELEGRINTVLNARQLKSQDRIVKALENVGFTTLDSAEEIARLNASVGPKVTNLYQTARSKPLMPTKKLKRLLDGDNAIKKIMSSDQLQTSLNNRRALGEEISNIDIIDATKRELDDQIGRFMREGSRNKARDLIQLKNIMLEEADKAIPEYKQARNLFSGKAALEDAVEQGKMLFKMAPRDIDEVIKGMGASEKRMYLAGAKDALIDKMDAAQTGADLVRRIFGRRGDIKRLQGLFPTREDFNLFQKAMEKEAEFIQTRRAIQGNSTTFRQAFDSLSFGRSMSDARALMGDPVAAVGVVDNLVSSIGKGKSEAVRNTALEKIGDILMAGKVENSRIKHLLTKGSEKQIERALNSVLSSKVARAAFIEQSTRKAKDDGL